MKRLVLLLMLAMPLAAADFEAAAPPAPTPTAAPTPAAQPTPRPSGLASRTQLFQITLLRAAVSGSDELTGLPKNAEKAVRDVRDFLPFKSYKLLDSGLVHAGESMPTGLRLDGVAPQQYDIKLSYQQSGTRLTIWYFSIYPVKAKNGSPLPPGVAPEAERPVIETSFSLDFGETIVVGSSKLGGDQALVVLLTAVPK
jgi:hypothetical protein